MTMICGVDPGMSGGLALLDSYGELVQVEDMPVVGGTGRDGGVNAHVVADIIGGWDHDAEALGGELIVVLENVHSMPRGGVAGMFKFGRSKGVIEGVTAAFRCRIVYVDPAKWKRDMKLNKDKGLARQMATDRWPVHSQAFARARDDGRAEAALIALWGHTHIS